MRNDKAEAIKASHCALAAYLKRRRLHTPDTQPKAAVGGFPYNHRSVAEVLATNPMAMRRSPRTPSR
jgi:hypothetical protein